MRTEARPDHIPWTGARVRITAGLMLAIFVVAMDVTVVGTALPTIGRELGDFALYPWIFSGYLLTSTTTVPLWGRLADLHGRKPMLMAGLAIFVGSSILCGFAPSMLALVLFRSLQGIGAGCVQPVVLTTIGDLFPLAQRARMQGLFSSVWAIAAVVGPLIGAGLVSTLGWRWIFFVNLPIGIAAASLIWAFQERREHSHDVHLDWAGVALLTLGVGILLYGLGSGSVGGKPYWPAVAAGVVLVAALVAVELRSPVPIIPLDLLRHPVIGPGVLVGTLAGLGYFTATVYIPVLVQNGLGGNPFQAGFTLAAVTVGWPLASMTSGRLLVRVGLRPLIVAGTALLVAAYALLLLDASRGILWVAADMAVLGAGMGAVTTPILIGNQTAVEWARRGAVTGLTQFSRTIGGAVGVALLGILVQSRLKGANPLAGGGAEAVRNALAPLWAASAAISLVALVASFGSARRVAERPATPRPRS